MISPHLRPIRLSRRPEPFDSDEYLYELKIDGFRSLAHISEGKGELISRNANVFRGFADLAAWIAEHLKVEDAVLDGEGATFARGVRAQHADQREAEREGTKAEPAQQ